jgi:hypothetical protein
VRQLKISARINKVKGRIKKTKNGKQKTEKQGKKRKKLGNKGFLREILKNGVVSGSKKCDFIGHICFWAKNEGKNECFFALFCVFFAKMNVF